MTALEPTATTPDASGCPMLAGIQHVGLTVTDVEISAGWYQRVLGLHRQFEEAHRGSDAGGHAVVLGTADMSLNVGLDYHPGNGGEGFDPSRTGLDHVCFHAGSVEDLNVWAAHLDRQGVANSGVYAMDGMPVSLLTFLDPDGIQLELIAFHS
jgi:catechol 2,3-dioxygenase-like lactoylglutathione lyase family enzyme